MPEPGVPTDWSKRLQHIDSFCSGQTLDLLIVSAPANLRYLSGFTGSSALLACGPRGRVFITDGRYDAVVRQQMTDEQMARLDVRRIESRYDLTLAAWLEERHAERVGFEASHVTVAMLQRWQAAAAKIDWRPTDDAVERLRIVKDASEVATLRRAGAMLSDVARNAGSWIAVGRSELEVARDVDRALERAGFERPAFDTIVASGPNTAYPHARPTDRRLVDGELVLLDFGGVLDGYCVDLTRMAGIGQLSASADKIVRAVHEAQLAAMKAIRPGVLGSDVDRAARDVLVARGLGDAFLHGTGHGLGLEVHESPRLARAETGARDVLARGMVCTIEPGAYVEGLGGARVEDDVLVTDDGCELLTDAPRELIVIR